MLRTFWRNYSGKAHGLLDLSYWAHAGDFFLRELGNSPCGLGPIVVKMTIFTQKTAFFGLWPQIAPKVHDKNGHKGHTATAWVLGTFCHIAWCCSQNTFRAKYGAYPPNLMLPLEIARNLPRAQNELKFGTNYPWPNTRDPFEAFCAQSKNCWVISKQTIAYKVKLSQFAEFCHTSFLQYCRALKINAKTYNEHGSKVAHKKLFLRAFKNILKFLS